MNLDQLMVISLGFTAWAFSLSYIAERVAETLRNEIAILRASMNEAGGKA